MAVVETNTSAVSSAIATPTTASVNETQEHTDGCPTRDTAATLRRHGDLDGTGVMASAIGAVTPFSVTLLRPMTTRIVGAGLFELDSTEFILGNLHLDADRHIEVRTHGHRACLDRLHPQ